MCDHEWPFYVKFCFAPVCLELYGAIHERAYDRYRTYASRTTAVRQAQVIHKKRHTYDVRKVVANPA